jgi:antirestriction protein ArdC
MFDYSRESNTRAKRDVYRQVTAQIVTAIEQGVRNWRMPWHTSGKFAFSPINVTSKKPYRGINTLCLWAAAQAKGYEHAENGPPTSRAKQGRAGSQGREGYHSGVLEVREQFHRITRGRRTAIRECFPPPIHPWILGI